MYPLLRKSILIGSVLLLTFLLIIFPEDALHASFRGLNIWWEVVFPSLLPFFIMAELLISLGAISIMGVLFEPIMRPLFNVSGSGSLALLMGYVSGYPTGAKITAKLRQAKKLSQTEAERLVSFTNASSPLFIFGAIAVGFFNEAKIGLLIALCHYGGNLLLGMILKYIYKDNRQARIHSKTKQTFFTQIRKEVHSLKTKDTKPIGEHLGDAVYHSVQTLIMVGGFITLFSVITSLLFQVNFLGKIAQVFQLIFPYINLPNSLSLPFITGIFEITIGIELIAQIKGLGLLFPLLVVSFLLGFNGFSIQAQVASILAPTDIRFSRYFYARLLHGFLASLLTFILFPVFFSSESIVTVYNPLTTSYEALGNLYAVYQIFGPPITILVIGFAFIYKLKSHLK